MKHFSDFESNFVRKYESVGLYATWLRSKFNKDS